MARQVVEGWIFDAYPEPEGMRLWFIDRDGRARHALDPWRPAFHLSGARAQLDRAAVLLGAAGASSWREVERQDLFSGASRRVLEVRVPPLVRDQVVGSLKDSGVSLYDADIHLVQLYHYERGHFPLAFGRFIVDGESLVVFELDDDPWAIDYAIPPLRTMELTLSSSEVAGKLDPNHMGRGKIVLTMDGVSRELEGPIGEQIESLCRRLREWDPDVIETDWGDSFLMPRLDRLARDCRLRPQFSRDPERAMSRRGERSFFTYGRAIYQGGARYLFGRWHLDRRNSFMLRETGRDGLFEIARIARIPVQRAARCTIGTSLSSMQMAWAWRHGVLIPMDKQQAEDFRPGSDLLVADKGGLVFTPEIGWHENVVEFDFTSMYPEMMVHHNISPETVNCACCPDNLVPEIGHHLCRKRRGLVPSVLEPILRKRAKYKAAAAAGGSGAASYKSRAAAHKWCLVCCFGYLGFKNARFGKIESHECVTAWGREVLLRAKESAERRGAHLVHALVDAIWIKPAPGTDVEELRQTIAREAGCPLALEGVYKWLRFCPSKRDELSGVPTRYFGAFADGQLKVRGLAMRRHDTPALIKALQADLLDKLARAPNLAACKNMQSDLADVAEDYFLRLKEGRVTAPELAITFTLSREPEHYSQDTVSSLAAKQLAAAGVRLHVGESVPYIITAAGDKVKEWRSRPLALMGEGLEYDAAKYLELARRGAEEVLDGLGVEIGGRPPEKRRSAAGKDRSRRSVQGELWPDLDADGSSRSSGEAPFRGPPSLTDFSLRREASR